jgi:hypothetical protein
MSLSDIFHISEITKENGKLKKENSQMRSYLNRAVEIKKENEKLKKENEDILIKYGELWKENENILEISSEIKKESEISKSNFELVHGMDLKQVIERISQLKSNEDELKSDILKIRAEIKQSKEELASKKDEILSIDEQIMLESFALYKPHFNFENSYEYKLKLEAIREEEKKMIKDDTAVFAPVDFYMNNSKSEGKKIINSLKKLLIRAFNNECDYCVDNVKFNNIEQSEKRISSSFDTLNSLGEITQVSITNEYKKLKFDELHIAFEYQRKKQEEKEDQVRLREELREQQKLEREIEAAREKIAKERKHYTQVIDDLTQRISQSTNEQDTRDLGEMLSKWQNKCDSLNEEEKLVDYREQNAKAGYIYVISNIGAFGKNVFKIGMTRRLEPTDRIYELGDASVPFPFDTHALIFSDNAPELEAKIHQHFHKKRLNKINNRREFFNADIDELEMFIRENYDKVVDFVKNPSADQYRESLLIKD